MSISLPSCAGATATVDGGTAVAAAHPPPPLPLPLLLPSTSSMSISLVSCTARTGGAAATSSMSMAQSSGSGGGVTGAPPPPVLPPTNRPSPLLCNGPCPLLCNGPWAADVPAPPGPLGPTLRENPDSPRGVAPVSCRTTAVNLTCRCAENQYRGRRWCSRWPDGGEPSVSVSTSSLRYGLLRKRCSMSPYRAMPCGQSWDTNRSYAGVVIASRT